MMISCLRASELIEKRCIQPLSRSESFQLFFHTRMCDTCRSYELQSSLIDKALERVIKSRGNKLSEEMLNADAFARIMNAIKKD